MKHFILAAVLVLAGCATGIESTMSKAQRQCEEMEALITNTNGAESVRIRCRWHQTFTGDSP